MSSSSRLQHAVMRLFLRLPPRLQALLRWRFVKFGLVGASGTVINIAVLYAAQEYLLVQAIADFHMRLNFSIALAISVATVNNFYWNRRLTWKDRAAPSATPTPTPNTSASASASANTKPEAVWRLFAKYVMAAALSIALQSLLTRYLALSMHYILANLLAIALASVCNFLANDRFTFRRRKPKLHVFPAAAPRTDASSAADTDSKELPLTDNRLL